MTIRHWLLAAGLVALFAGAGLSTRLPRDEPDAAHSASPAPASQRPQAAARDEAPPRTRLGSRPAFVAATTAAERNNYEDRSRFQTRVGEFLVTAPRLDAAARARAAAELDREIDAHERASTLSAGEALLLRAELIRLSVDDELVEAERLTDLTERYRADAERRSAAWAARDDRQLLDYRAREQRIVEEVMAMPTVPGGIERGEYLRQRLQRERELAFR